jgi:transposase InsO family protein
MSDNLSTDSVSVAKIAVKLEGPTNYHTWSVLAKAHLKGQGTWGHITGDTPRPVKQADGNNKPESDWLRHDDKAQCAIMNSVDKELLHLIEADMTAKEMWDILATECRQSDMATRMALKRQLHAMRLVDAASVNKHIATMGSIRSQLADMGKPVDDEEAAMTLLNSVPDDDTAPQWQMFLRSYTASNQHLTWASVSAAIRAEASQQLQKKAEIDRALEQSNAQLTAVAAYAARSQGYKKPTDKSDGRRPQRYCTHCNRRGHVEETCFDLHPELRDKPKQAYFITVDTDAGAALACYSADATVSRVASGSTAAGLWYVDSGATHSLTSDKGWFTQLYNCVPCTVTTANNGKLVCTQRGTVVLNVRDGSITLQDVLYVPSLTVNLLSVSGLLNSGYRIRFTLGGCSISKRNKLLTEVKGHNNAYPLLASQQTSQALSAAVSNKGLDWVTAHARLGHLNTRAIQLMHDKRMAHGVELPNSGSPDDVKQCVGCIVGKAHRLPFPAQASHRSQRPLQLVHSDICGPVVVEHGLSNGKQLANKWYLLTFVDDYSRQLWVQLIADKTGDTVLRQFRQYKLWAEKYCGFDIKAIRTDGGGEYVNEQFSTYLHTMGIQRQMTTAHTPQQNGVAERVNRTIMEAARSMLHAAGLPMSFWTYAVRTAVYLRNRSPTRALNNITPYEAWRGEKPDLSHLRVFGCRAYVYLHKAQRSSTSKLAARAMPGIFVGYPTEAKAWLVWDPVGKKVHTSRDVRFMEAVPGSTPVSVPSAQSAGSNNDSTSIVAAEPADAERSIIVDALVTDDVESGSDSDDEAVAVVPAEPAVAVVPAAVAVDQPVSPPAHPSTPPPVAPTASPASSSVSSSVSLSSRQSRQVRLSRKERELRKLASFNMPGKTEESDEQQQAAMFVFAAHVSACISEPCSYEEAAQSPYRVQWERAMQEELDSIKANDTYALVPLPAGRQAIGSKWVYKVKRHADGSVDRFKARLVAKGYSQLYGIDFTETFAPVVRFSSLRAVLAIAAANDYEIHQMDVKTAFLNGDLDEDIYMEQPDGHRAAGDQADYVWKLQKSLYGLKQAGRAWNKKMDAALIELGLRPTLSDSCVYVIRQGSSVLFLLVYVDDLLLVSNDMSQLESVKAALHSRFEMKDMGEAEFILGVQIRRDRAKRQLYLSQAEYVRTVLERFDMQDCKPAASPMATGAKLLKTESDSECARNVPYASAVGALMYLALVTRPDIAFAVTALSQFNAAPSHAHWQAVKRVFRYLQGTRHHELTFGCAGGVDRQLYGYSDSDWGNDVNDRRSYTGWVFMLHDGAVSWQACKQRTVALSSTDAEYMAAAQATREAVWWRTLTTELGLPPSAATTIYSDSQGAIARAKNPEQHKRAKHMDIQYHYVREQVQAGSVVMPYISTELMVADVLTKPLAVDRHAALTVEMGVRAAHKAA